MSYSVELTPAAGRQLKKLPKAAQRRIAPRLANLANDPRPSGVKKLAAAECLYRLRVGDCRAVYRIEDQRLLVLVVKIGDRQAIYRHILRNI